MTPGPKPHPVPQASVTDSPAIHVQSEEPAEPFWRAITVVGLFFLAVTIAAAIGGPVLLMLMFWSPWLLFLLVIALVGGWLVLVPLAAIPILLLVAIAVGICLLNDRRRARRRAADPDAVDYADLDDDEASPIDLEPSPVDAPSPVDEPDEKP